MRCFLKPLGLLVALMVTGLWRMDFEQQLTLELREQALLPVKLEIGTRDHIEQTSAAVAMGGLRTVVASFLNLRSVGHFMNQRWYDLAELYDVIVDLAPHTRYYWDSGAWHMAYNAASFYIHDSSLPPLRRREAWRGYVHRGKTFLEKGVRNNPNDWRLSRSLALLLIDPNKFVAFPNREAAFLEAAEICRQAESSGQASQLIPRLRLYALARVPGHEREALELAKSLHSRDPRNRTPTLKMLLYVLQCHIAPDSDVGQLALDIFDTEQKAYAALARQWTKTREGYPTDGLARGIVVLEQKLAIPEAESVLKTPPPPPHGAGDWFHQP